MTLYVQVTTLLFFCCAQRSLQPADLITPSSPVSPHLSGEPAASDNPSFAGSRPGAKLPAPLWGRTSWCPKAWWTDPWSCWWDIVHHPGKVDIRIFKKKPNKHQEEKTLNRELVWESFPSSEPCYGWRWCRLGGQPDDQPAAVCPPAGSACPTPCTERHRCQRRAAGMSCLQTPLHSRHPRGHQSEEKQPRKKGFK